MCRGSRSTRSLQSCRQACRYAPVSYSGVSTGHALSPSLHCKRGVLSCKEVQQLLPIHENVLRLLFRVCWALKTQGHFLRYHSARQYFECSWGFPYIKFLVALPCWQFSRHPRMSCGGQCTQHALPMPLTVCEWVPRLEAFLAGSPLCMCKVSCSCLLHQHIAQLCAVSQQAPGH